MKDSKTGLKQDWQPAGATSNTFQEYFALLSRGKFVILGSVVFLTAAMAVYNYVTPPVYETAAVVLVHDKGGRITNPLLAASENGTPGKIINEIGILRSWGLAKTVAIDLMQDPYLDASTHTKFPILLPREGSSVSDTGVSISEVASRVSLAMDFVPVRESDMLRIVARSTNPREAATLANDYLEAYQSQITNQSRSRSKSVREFLDERLGEQRSSLQRAESSLRGFMETSGLVSLDAESKRVVGELSQLEAERNALDVDIQSTAKRISALQNELPAQESSVTNTISQANDPYIRQMQEQLARLEVQRDVIKAQNDPALLGQEMYKRKLKDLDDQIATLHGNLQKRSSEFIQSIVPSLAAGSQTDGITYVRTLRTQLLEAKFLLETQQSKRKALAGIIDDYELKFKKIPYQSIELARLQREKLSAEKLYSLVEEKFNEAAIAEKSEFGYVDIVDRAGVPNIPVKPDSKRNLLLGVLMGLGFGVATVIIKDILDVRTRTPEQLKRKGYTPIAEVGTMSRELRKLRGGNGIPSAVKKFDERLWLTFSPFSQGGESYRRLRTNILHIQLERPLRTILISSAHPREGKTTTSCNLGVVLAETNKRVLLIDADLRRPMIHACFGIPQSPGLTDILYEKSSVERAIQRNVVENLDILPCGAIVRNPGSVAASDNMKEFLEKMKKMYDWVLIDTSPLLAVSDSAMLSSCTDGTILSVAAGTTRFAALDRAAEFVHDAGGTLIGVVLNMFDARKAYGGYYGGYRYGHYGPEHAYYGR